MSAKTYENILVDTPQDGVGLVRLNRPKALNALSRALMTELVEVLEAHDLDDSIRCHVITGDDRAFAAGADIKEMAEASPVEMLTRNTLGLWDRVASLRKPLIAAVSGWCLGGGCEMALSCDMIIASDTAKFGEPETAIGVMPGAGGSQRLTRAVGKAISMEMILNSRTLSADEALHLGMVNRVVPVDAYLAEALKLAREIAARPSIAVQLAKEAVNMAFEGTLAEGLVAERRNFYFLFSTEDQKEGMAAFVAKRDPKWKGK